MLSGIYAIINIYNDKCYIGSAIKLKRRWQDHLKHLKSNKHHSILLQRAFNKHWINPFLFIVIEYCEKDRLIEKELHWMNELKPEYNLAPIAGSCLGYKHTVETKKKMSEANKNKKLSEETKLKISISNKGRQFRRKINKWPCEDGNRCKCYKCRQKRGELKRNWYGINKAKKLPFVLDGEPIALDPFA